jgi:hypothetical protein
MSETEKHPVKVRGGEARKAVELDPDPDKPKAGQIKYDPKTKALYVYVEP